MKKITIYLMLISILSQTTGFIRELTLSYYYGASNISDAYLISITLPMVIFSFIGRSLTTSFIPVYAKIENEKGKSSAIFFTQNLMSILF
jgi:putative peptidoglycan lipid II flippase